MQLGLHMLSTQTNSTSHQTCMYDIDFVSQCYQRRLRIVFCFPSKANSLSIYYTFSFMMGILFQSTGCVSCLNACFCDRPS